MWIKQGEVSLSLPIHVSLWDSPCQHTPSGSKYLYIVSACQHLEPGEDTPSRYLALTGNTVSSNCYQCDGDHDASPIYASCSGHILPSIWTSCPPLASFVLHLRCTVLHDAACQAMLMTGLQMHTNHQHDICAHNRPGVVVGCN